MVPKILSELALASVALGHLPSMLAWQISHAR
jgi:hypothetical protein